MPDARKLFETLVREHADMLTVYLRASLGNSPDVDDVFQETMIVAWKRLDDFDHTRPFAPWLRGIARNLVLAQRRRRGRTLCTDHCARSAGVHASSNSRQGKEIRGRRNSRLYKRVLMRCRTTYRSVVDHRYFRKAAVQQNLRCTRSQFVCRKKETPTSASPRLGMH